MASDGVREGWTRWVRCSDGVGVSCVVDGVFQNNVKIVRDHLSGVAMWPGDTGPHRLACTIQPLGRARKMSGASFSMTHRGTREVFADKLTGVPKNAIHDAGDNRLLQHG